MAISEADVRSILSDQFECVALALTVSEGHHKGTIPYDRARAQLLFLWKYGAPGSAEGVAAIWQGVTQDHRKKLASATV